MISFFKASFSWKKFMTKFIVENGEHKSKFKFFIKKKWSRALNKNFGLKTEFKFRQMTVFFNLVNWWFENPRIKSTETLTFLESIIFQNLNKESLTKKGLVENAVILKTFNSYFSQFQLSWNCSKVFSFRPLQLFSFNFCETREMQLRKLSV